MEKLYIPPKRRRVEEGDRIRHVNLFEYFERTNCFSIEELSIGTSRGIDVRTISYAQIKSKVLKISSQLKEIIPQNTCVAIIGTSNSFYIEALLSVLKCNSFFLPLNEHDLAETHYTLLKSANINVVMAHSEYKFKEVFNDMLYISLDPNGIIEYSHVTPLTSSLTDIAYVMRTSGSTGNPKLVYVSHESIISNLESILLEVDIKACDHVLMVSPITFDPSLVDIFIAMASGSCLSMISGRFHVLDTLLSIALEDCNFAFLQCTPTFLRFLSTDTVTRLLCSLNYLFLGGEEFLSKSEFLQLLPQNLVKYPRIFNIYGITELSVWASMEEVSMKDWLGFDDNSEPIGIGLPLNQTDMRLVSIDTHEALRCLDSSNTLGIMEHIPTCRLELGSVYRKCYTNGTYNRWVDTGDLVKVVNGRIIYVGRNDFVIKRLGKRINLLEIENIIRGSNLSPNVAVVYDNGYIKAIIDEKSKDNIDLIKRWCLMHLPDYMRPDYYFIRSVPIKHGKVQRTRLSDKDTLVDIVIKGLGICQPCDILESYFVQLGGTSITLEGVVNSIMSNFSLLNTKRRDITFSLLHKKIKDVLPLLDSTDINFPVIDKQEPVTDVTKSTIAESPIGEIIYKGNLRLLDRINYHVNSCNLNLDNIRLKWKVDLEKCIDASPIYAKASNSSYIYIASHQGIVVCISTMTGTVIWETRLSYRIEGSISFNKEMQQVIVGCFHGLVYYLNALNGNIETEMQISQENIKSPALVDSKGRIWISSYENRLYMIMKDTVVHSFETKKPIFATGIEDAARGKIYFTSLDGWLYCFHSDSFEIIWKFDFKYPIFCSPIVDLENGNIYCCSVKGVLIGFTSEGDSLFEFSCGDLVYTSLSFYTDKSILLGCYDKYLYCVDKERGELRWKTFLNGKPYSIPFCSFSDKYPDNPIICIPTIEGNLNFLVGNSLIRSVKLNNEIFSSPIITDEGLCLVGCRDNYLYTYASIS